MTTFKIQLAGKRVVFEPHAVVWAEEPRELDGALEAAAALGPRQRAGDAALPRRLVPALARRAGSAASASR